MLIWLVVSDVSAGSALCVQDQANQEDSLDERPTTLRTPGAAAPTKQHPISEHCIFKLRIYKKEFHILEPTNLLRCDEL